MVVSEPNPDDQARLSQLVKNVESHQASIAQEEKAAAGVKRRVKFDYYAVLDFECTCDSDNTGLDHEIIEFPVVFLNTHTLEIDFVFRRFVKPTERPVLTEFCMNLTGITQEQVDAADSLDVVLQEFHDFIGEHNLVLTEAERSNDNPLFTIATDGPWDITRFLKPECSRKVLRFEKYWRRWC